MDRREEEEGSWRGHQSHDEAGVLHIPRVRSWSDVVAILSLIGIFTGGLIWGMKLEHRYDTLDSKIAANRTEFMQTLELVRSDVAGVRSDIGEIKLMLQRGILPVSEARTDALDKRIDALEGQEATERGHKLE